MLKSIHDIYSRDKTFIDFEAQDLEDGAVWFNNSEFARYHDVRGKKILSIFTKNIRDKSLEFRANKQNPEGVTQCSGVLYCRAKDIKTTFQAGSSLKFDGELYTISEADLQGQVWRVVLEGKK